MIRAPRELLDYHGIDRRKQEAQIAMRSFLSFPNDPDIVYLLQSESMLCGFQRAYRVVTFLVFE
jgi:hypothetical protein